MSNVVAFRPAEQGRIARDEPMEGGLILLFTGVRYMREECVSEAASCEQPVAGEDAASDLDVSTERLKA